MVLLCETTRTLATDLRGDGMTARGERQGTTVTTVERSGRVRDQDDQREEASIAE